ncbi:MAG: cytochrome C [Candidatus Hydrogenedentota bacterium]|nr:MAG: cytochrome C [Candidatus Hydrogenedentota bacterium]
MKKYILGALIMGLVACQKQNQDFNTYRQWWHVKTLELKSKHPLYNSFGGIHHIYANELAYKALKANQTYPEGAMFVFDLLEVQSNEEATAEGKRKVLAYMKKTSNHPDTGNWEFGAYKGGDKSQQIVTDAKAQCFACHASQKEKDYVFSSWRP